MEARHIQLQARCSWKALMDADENKIIVRAAEYYSCGIVLRSDCSGNGFEWNADHV